MSVAGTPGAALRCAALPLRFAAQPCAAPRCANPARTSLRSRRRSLQRWRRPRPRAARRRARRRSRWCAPPATAASPTRRRA